MILHDSRKNQIHTRHNILSVFPSLLRLNFSLHAWVCCAGLLWWSSWKIFCWHLINFIRGWFMQHRGMYVNKPVPSTSWKSFTFTLHTKAPREGEKIFAQLATHPRDQWHRLERYYIHKIKVKSSQWVMINISESYFKLCRNQISFPSFPSRRNTKKPFFLSMKVSATVAAADRHSEALCQWNILGRSIREEKSQTENFKSSRNLWIKNTKMRFWHKKYFFFLLCVREILPKSLIKVSTQGTRQKTTWGCFQP